MKPDLYTKTVLTVIAICVAWLSVKDLAITRMASAADQQVTAVRLVTCLTLGAPCLDVQKDNPLVVSIAKP